MGHFAEMSLVVLYSIVAIYISTQLILLFRMGHKRVSYKVVFNSFALCWMVLRALFWLLFISSDDFAAESSPWFYILFWMPHTIIYMTFATLAIFLNKVIKRRSWTQKYRMRALLIYTVLGSVDVIGTFALCILAGQSISDGGDASVQNGFESGGSGVLFFVLGGVFM